jgi:hypothetical protein
MSCHCVGGAVALQPGHGAVAAAGHDRRSEALRLANATVDALVQMMAGVFSPA